MPKKPQLPKHTPHRTCVVCRTVRPKRELVRLVRVPDGGVVVDVTGKSNGRGAYLCRQQRCWLAQKMVSRVEQALRTTLTPEVRSALAAYAQDLPPSLDDDEANT